MCDASIGASIIKHAYEASEFEIEVSVNGEITELGKYAIRQRLEPGDIFSVRAIGDEKTYQSSEWSGNVTYDPDADPLPIPHPILLRIPRLIPTRITCTQIPTETVSATHGYGLGVSCPMGEKRYVDFGWGGAAGAFLAVDLENNITMYFATHILPPHAQGLRSMLFRLVRAELIDHSDLDDLYRDLKKLHNYNLTY